jgi:hypothetical protein
MEEVAGSNPAVPTEKVTFISLLFLLPWGAPEPERPHCPYGQNGKGA